MNDAMKKSILTTIHELSAMSSAELRALFHAQPESGLGSLIARSGMHDIGVRMVALEYGASAAAVGIFVAPTHPSFFKAEYLNSDKISISCSLPPVNSSFRNTSDLLAKSSGQVYVMKSSFAHEKAFFKGSISIESKAPETEPTRESQNYIYGSTQGLSITMDSQEFVISDDENSWLQRVS